MIKWIMLGLLAAAILLVLANWKKLLPKIKDLRIFADEVAFEMNKVAWPSRDEVVQSTGLVLVVTLILTVMVGIVDSIFGQLVRFLF